MNTMAVGMIGLGWIGQSHLADLATRPDVNIKAVCDVDSDRVATTAEKYDAHGYTDSAELFAESLDAVWICTPPQHHLAPAQLAFDRRVPTYLEKPVARGLEDGSEIVRLAEASGVVCAVGYQWRALELLDPLRAEMAGQQVVSLLGQSIGPTMARPWFLDQSTGGGNLLERGSHQIDLVRAIAGEVECVAAVASTVRVDRLGVPDRDIDDALTLVMRMQSGALATIVIAWTPAEIPGRYGLDVITGDAVLRVALDPHFQLSGHSRGRTVSANAVTIPFTASNTSFLAAVRASDPTAVACTPADALATLRVASAGERALATGLNVEVS